MVDESQVSDMRDFEMREEGSSQRRRLANHDVAAELALIGDILQILDANRFRVIAFQNAAESIRTLGQDINTLHAEGKLLTIPAVGKGIADALDELLSNGEAKEFEELKAKVPRGVVEIVQLPDVGPKTAKRLWQELDITSVDELKAAAEAGKIRVLKGFGAKSEEKILRGIELAAKRGDARTPLGEARPLAQALVAGLRQRVSEDAITRLEVGGSLRRWQESIGDVDILVVSDRPGEVMDAFVSLPQVSDIIGKGETKSSIVLGTGLRVDLLVVEAKNWGAALQYFTGNKEHNVALREIATKQGWSLNERGLTATGSGEAKEGEQKFFAEEADLYEFLGLRWMPPELRTNHGELAAARAGKLPNLIEIGDMRGELHGHSTWSDGTAPIAEMAAAAQERGYSYWAVCDHSVGLGMVGGLDGERLLAQAEEIAALNAQYEREGLDFRLLRGTEVEILADGSLGLPDEVLAQLDVVVASIHSGLRQDRETITARCLKAIRNPHVDILGHATGRIIESRPPSEIDMEQVLQVCAETGTVVEINAHPSRLDISDVYARRALELGSKLAINCDAHVRDGMKMMEYGIGTARRGWVEAKDVVNTYPLAQMLHMLKDKRKN
ncbi:MAG: DNA polymerase/3'-5' exonuclease PolX [Caldilineaceae bacterium]|nr:DNA polymerase/3'-5' exonuclease PolX [Caldilineaceae bacterium]